MGAESEAARIVRSQGTKAKEYTVSDLDDASVLAEARRAALERARV